MHKSVADWLRDCERKSSLYKITEEDVRTAHRRMVEFSSGLGTGEGKGGISGTYRHSLSVASVVFFDDLCNVVVDHVFTP